MIDVGVHVAVVPFQDFQPLAYGGLATPAQLSEKPHVGDRHPGSAQPKQKLQPGEIGCCITPLPAAGSIDGRDKPGLFVVAQRVFR